MSATDDVAKWQQFLALYSPGMAELVAPVVKSFPPDYETVGLLVEKDPVRITVWTNMVKAAQRAVYGPTIDAKLAAKTEITQADVISAKVAAGKLVLKPGLVLDAKGLEVIAVAVDPPVDEIP